MPEGEVKRAVWKFPISPGAFQVELPMGAEILSVQFQDSTFGQGPQLWALVDPDAPKVSVRMLSVMTGESFTINDHYVLDHVGSMQSPSGIVIHVFKVN